MKNVKQMLVLIVVAVLSLTTQINAQTPVNDFYQFSPKEMIEMSQKFAGDAGWSAILKEVNEKKFTKIKHEKAAWGFKGKVKDKSGKEVDVVFCTFDYYNPDSKNGQGCSMIWKKVGNEIYKAYLIFPEGEKDMDKALALSGEWYADANGKIQKAQSWGRCFRRCVGGTQRTVVDAGGVRFEVPANCGLGCLASIAVCGGATAILAVASSPGAPVTFPTLAIVFGICAGASCGVCIGACALGCI